MIGMFIYFSDKLTQGHGQLLQRQFPHSYVWAVFHLIFISGQLFIFAPGPYVDAENKSKNTSRAKTEWIRHHSRTNLFISTNDGQVFLNKEMEFILLFAKIHGWALFSTTITPLLMVKIFLFLEIYSLFLKTVGPRDLWKRMQIK